MRRLDWKKAEAKLQRMLTLQDGGDIYLVLNVVAPLRTRFFNGERTARLYNEIMQYRPSAYSRRIASHSG